MPKAKIEHQLLREFGKLSPEAKGEVFAYTKWMRDIEVNERKKKLKGEKNALGIQQQVRFERLRNERALQHRSL